MRWRRVHHHNLECTMLLVVQLTAAIRAGRDRLNGGGVVTDTLLVDWWTSVATRKVVDIIAWHGFKADAAARI